MQSDHNQNKFQHFELEQVICCPSCKSTQFHLAYKPDISQCEKCHLHFHNPRPTQEVILQSYENGLTFQRWQHELEIRKLLWQKRLELILRHKTSGKLIDIGTGDGYFLGFAKQHFDTVATETSLKGVQYAKHHGHDVYHGIFNELLDDEDKFDVVTLWHVLEHVPSPNTLLQQIKQHLNHDSVLALAVPNELTPLLKAKYQKVKASPFGSLGRGEEIHLTHFTPRVLKKLLQQHGFKILNFGVDDVHVYERRKKMIGFHANQVINLLTGTHFDTAMYVVCKLN